MMVKIGIAFAVAAACLASIATSASAHAQTARGAVTVKHPPVVNPGDSSSSWSAQQNILDAKRYEQMLRTNPAFRKARMQRDHFSRASSKLPLELQPGLILD